MVEYTMMGSKELPKAVNTLDHWYKQLMCNVLDGNIKDDRTGTGTTSIFGPQFRHKMKDGFPLITSKKMYTKGVVIELLWFLGVHMTIPHYQEYGRTNIKYLLDNDCNIWVGDAYKQYLKLTDTEEPSDYLIEDVENSCLRKLTKEEYIEAIKKGGDFTVLYGDLGPIYGHQWTNFGGKETLTELKQYVLCEKVEDMDDVFDAVLQDACEMPKVYQRGRSYLPGFNGFDQIANLVHDLKTNPDSRRLIVTAWNPQDLDKQVLPPCHYGFQCYTRKLSVKERLALIQGFDGIPDLKLADELNIPTRELSLSWNQRSVDVPLGLPFNIASYGLLLEMLAKVVNMVPGELIGNLGDTHIYNNQLPFIQEQLGNPTFPLPKLVLAKREFLHDYEATDFKFEGLQSAGKVNYPLSN